MSDQHVIQDWRAYFDSLGPGNPYPVEQLEAQRGEPNAVLIIDQNPGGPLDRIVLHDSESILEQAREIWEARGRPQMWLQWGWDAPWHVAAVVVPRANRPGRR